MPAKIEFGTDGWRAIIAEDFSFENVRLCAQAVADHLREFDGERRGLVVGYDTRFGSDRFAEAVAEVAAANGIPVLLSNAPCPTPVASYSVVNRGAAGAVIITASHNPAAWNGFKFKPDFGGSASPEVTEALEGRIRELQSGQGEVRRMSLAEAEKAGQVNRFDPAPPYLARLAQLVDLPRIRSAGLKVAVDSMHGAGSGYFRRLLQGGSTQVTELRAEPNPAFPDMHNPEPIAHNLEPLTEWIAANRTDLGLATDGDSDRIGVVDERGTFVNQLQMYALLLLYLLEVRGKRGPAVRSVTSTSMADRLGERYGIPVYETPVGFKYVGPRMIETQAIFGGEESGGFGFGDHIPERDALLAGLCTLDLMVALKLPMSGVLDYLTERAGPSFYDRLDVLFPSEERAAIAQRVAEAAPEQLDGQAVVRVNEIDGKKFFLADGSWLLIRFSGTEPLLRIYTEATSADMVGRILGAGRSIAGV
ncbi:MAG: phosphoglucomutase/phosphomannomutase family protein [Chloroflexi bacterium]|nr:phosphoglucomutase/phosphomannomutase family protein [Chloroflexota bacterium]